MEEFYRVNEVAEKLKVHPRTIRRKIEKGEIEAVKIGRQYRIKKEPIDELYGSNEPMNGEPELSSVSTVIEVGAISEEQSKEISSKITSVYLSMSFDGTINCLYNRDSRRMKVFLDCTLEAAPEILSIIKVYILKYTTNEKLL